MTQERAEQLLGVYGELEEEVGVINRIVREAIQHGMPYSINQQNGEHFNSNEDALVYALKIWISMKGVGDAVFVSHTPGCPVSLGGDICLSIMPYAELKNFWQKKENEKAKPNNDEEEKTEEAKEAKEETVDEEKSDTAGDENAE